MGKVLKIAGLVIAGVGLAVVTGGVSLGFSISTVLGASAGIAGLSVGALLGIGAGLELAGSLLSPRPKVPDQSASNADRLTASIDVRTPRKIVFGATALATDIRDQEFSSDQSFLHRFFVCAAHRCGGIDEIWFDDKLAWSQAGVPDGVIGSDFTGYFALDNVLEGSAANAVNLSARMGAARRYTGLCYTYFRYKLTGNSKNATSPFAQSITTRVTIIGRGAYLYDPRLDSTVSGGSGAHRADDQTTWVAGGWNEDRNRNPALQLLWYLLGWRIQNPVTSAWVLSVGKGVPPDRIDLVSFMDAANLCDEAVTLAVGGTEPRYRGDGIFSEGDDPSTVVENLKAAMNAVLDDVDGKIRVSVLHNDLALPVADFTAADVLGSFSWSQTPSLSDRFNEIRGGFTDASHAALFQLTDYPASRIDSPDGIERLETINYPLVQSASQVQRLNKKRLQRQAYGGVFKAQFQATMWKCQKGSVIRLTFPALGWSQKLFRIAQMNVQVNGIVDAILREEHPDLYAWDHSELPPVVGAAPTTYDPILAPIIVAIGENAADIEAITSDGILSHGWEKQKAIIDWTALANDQTALYAKFVALGSPSDLTSSVAAMNTAMTALADYLNSLSPAWSDTTQDTPIDAATWVSKWNAAYEKVADARAAITGRPGADAAPNNFNLVKYSNFGQGTRGVLNAVSSDFTLDDFSTHLDAATGYQFAQVGGTIAAGATNPVFNIYMERIPVSPGERYAVQALFQQYLDAGGATVNQALLAVTPRDASNTPLGDVVLATHTGIQSSFAPLQAFWTAPAGCAFVYMFVQHVFNAPTSGTAHVYGYLAHPMISSATADQTAFPPYSPGQEDGATGGAGPSGSNNLVVYGYQRATSPPAGPTATATYTFSTKALTDLDNGWTATQPSGTDPLWVIAATASSAADIDAIAAAEWGSAVLLGASGLDGLNSAPVFVYQRATSAPALPSDPVTYNFSSGATTGLNNGWVADIPAGTDPIYVSQATASSTNATDTIAPSEWAAAQILAQNGAPGLNNATIYAYQRSASGAPALPSATATYDFAARTLTGLDNGWIAAQPAGTDPLYIIAATASSTAATDTIASSEWSGAVLLGASGVDGLNSASVFIYQRASSAPALPSAPVTYAFADGSASGLDNGWLRTIPSGSDPIYFSQATAASTSATDTIAATEWAGITILAQNGGDGLPGENAIGITLTNNPIAVPAFSDGTLQPGALTSAIGTMKIRLGSTDVSGSTTFSIVSGSASGMTATIDGSGNYAVTGVSADSGQITLRAAYGGVNYDLILSTTRAKQGSAAYSKTVPTTGSPALSSGTYFAALTQSIPAATGIGIQATAHVSYGPPSSGTITAQGKLQYSLDMTTWIDIGGSEVTGPNSTAASGDAGDINTSGVIPSATIGNVSSVGIRLLLRKSAGSASTAPFTGGLTGAWVAA